MCREADLDVAFPVPSSEGAALRFLPLLDSPAVKAAATSAAVTVGEGSGREGSTTVETLVGEKTRTSSMSDSLRSMTTS